MLSLQHKGVGQEQLWADSIFSKNGLAIKTRKEPKDVLLSEPGPSGASLTKHLTIAEMNQRSREPISYKDNC